MESGPYRANALEGRLSECETEIIALKVDLGVGIVKVEEEMEDLVTVSHMTIALIIAACLIVLFWFLVDYEFGRQQEEIDALKAQIEAMEQVRSVKVVCSVEE